MPEKKRYCICDEAFTIRGRLDPSCRCDVIEWEVEKATHVMRKVLIRIATEDCEYDQYENHCTIKMKKGILPLAEIPMDDLCYSCSARKVLGIESQLTAEKMHKEENHRGPGSD